MRHQLMNPLGEITNTLSFNELMGIATQSLLFHNKETSKFLTIVKGNFRANFFNIIDLDSFIEKMQNANKSLGRNGYLPSSNPYELLDLSELTYSRNDTHISIHTKMPVVTQPPYVLHEFVPLPIKVDNSLYDTY